MNSARPGEARESLVLGGALDVVPRARRFARTTLAAANPAVVGDAELVVTELVTNAALHGEPPITVTVAADEHGVRIEVTDRSRAMPMPGGSDRERTTGRGLSLVDALADEWGVAATDEHSGKTVWAELGRTARDEPEELSPLDVAALLEAWSDDEPDEHLYRVHLGAVPTALLLGAKTHIEEVVRELTLVRAGRRAREQALPPGVAALIDTVTVDFASARDQIKRQALAAAKRGDKLTDVELRLPAGSADHGERYLRALDEVDRYARDARLLTLASPPAHRSFRRWYVQALVDQLRAVARGDPPPPIPPPPWSTANRSSG